jgi:predicted dehydrogenase
MRLHLPSYLARPERVRIVGVADPSPERLAEARAVTGLPEDRAFTDVAGILALPDLDVVDICSPPRFHAQAAIAAAAAGKPILCEKPITTMPAEAAAMLGAAARAGVAVGMMHNYLFFPEFVAARRIIESGEIGDVRMVIVNYLGVPDLPGVEGAAKSWRHEPAASGGGVLMDMLHVMYVAELLLGRRAQRVSAHVEGGPGHDRVEALALCRLETDGPTALVNVGWGIGPGGVSVEGDRGTLRITWQGGGTNPFVPLESIEVTTGRGTRREPVVPAEDTMAQVRDAAGLLIDDFLDALEAGRPPAATGDDGLHALELVVAAYESAALGRTVHVPLDRADPMFLRGATAAGELGGPAWSAVTRQRLFTTGPQA